MRDMGHPDPSVSPADTLRRTQQHATHLLGSVLTWGGVKELIGTDLYDRSVLALRSLDDLWDERERLLAVGERDRRQIARLTERLTVLADPSHWMQRRVGGTREWVWIGPALGDVLVGARAVLADEENADG